MSQNKHTWTVSTDAISNGPITVEQCKRCGLIRFSAGIGGEVITYGLDDVFICIVPPCKELRSCRIYRKDVADIHARGTLMSLVWGTNLTRIRRLTWKNGLTALQELCEWFDFVCVYTDPTEPPVYYDGNKQISDRHGFIREEIGKIGDKLEDAYPGSVGKVISKELRRLIPLAAVVITLYPATRKRCSMMFLKILIRLDKEGFFRWSIYEVGTHRLISTCGLAGYDTFDETVSEAKHDILTRFPNSGEKLIQDATVIDETKEARPL